MKILLLNPPGSRNYLRDYYCTTVSKSGYYYHPVDILYLSGTLAAKHEVRVLDALARGRSPEAAFAEIERLRPDLVVSLMAAPSFEEDRAFLKELKKRSPKTRLIGTGDVFRELGERIFKLLPGIEASLVDFSTDDILHYLRGPEGRPVDNVTYRDGDRLIAGPEKHGKGTFSVPLPRIDLFPRELYTFPFVRGAPFMTVLSDFGCPYTCSFCPMSTLGFKLRPVDEVLGEIRAAWNTGYREVHFRDQTFGANKNRSLELCAALHQEFPKLTWSCFSRVDVLDEQRIKAFVEAGCHTVIVGIEFDDDAMQKTLGKNIAKTQMFEAVRACRAHGLRIAGTFILGLPDQDEAAILRTGKLARDLNLDFASFNLATPRLGTTWRKELLEQGGIDKERWGMDTVGGTTAWDKAKLSPQALNRLRSKVERDFYLRPGYLLRKLAALRSTAEALTYLRNGLSILFGKH